VKTVEKASVNELSSKQDQVLLDTLYRQAIRSPVPMAIVAVTISMLYYNRVNSSLVAVWALCVISMQAVRFFVVRYLASDQSRASALRLRYCVYLSLCNSLLLCSSVIFFSQLLDVHKAILCMILIGVASGTVATSHGYRPIFLVFVVPILFTLSMAWIFAAPPDMSTEQSVALVALTVMLGLLLYASSRDVYEAFLSDYITKEKLEVALVSERSANAAKTRFLAAASHDLRQPLHTMSMLSAALTLRDLDEKSANIAEKISTAMNDLSSELDSLLDISKLDAGVVQARPSYFDLRSSLSRVVESYIEVSEVKALSLEYEQHPPLMLNLDRSIFERVMRNLLDNAIKYTNKGSVKVNVISKKGCCVIEIIDTGVGIPDIEIDNVRAEFYQLDNPARDRQKGLGLGLSIVWRFVPLLNGTISMDSSVGKGTTVTLEIPCDPLDQNQAPNQYETNHLSNTTALRLDGVRILLVEDDLDVRLGTTTLLESRGCVVFGCSSTSEALDVKLNSHPDIALVDLRLPDGDDGFFVIHALRNTDIDFPVIILSGETSSERLLEAQEMKCKYLVKPVEMHELVSEIDNVLHHSQTDQV